MWLGLAGLTAGIFFLALPYRPYPGSFVVKAAPVVCLALYAAGAPPFPGQVGVIAALMLSAGGDVALEWQRTRSERYFLIGLGLFLAAHLVYAGVLALGWQPAGAPWGLAVLVILAALLLGWRLYPHLGRLRAPVGLYILAITSMVVLACLRQPVRLALIAGAALFMLSDALIAWHRFVRPLPGRDWLVMSTYYIAQGLLTWGLVGPGAGG